VEARLHWIVRRHQRVHCMTTSGLRLSMEESASDAISLSSLSKTRGQHGIASTRRRLRRRFHFRKIHRYWAHYPNLQHFKIFRFRIFI